MKLDVSKKNGELGVLATALLPVPATQIIRAHTHPHYAASFRDIQQYSKFEIEGCVIRTEYPARIGPLKMTMKVMKRFVPETPTRSCIEFWTAPDCLAAFQGRWTIREVGRGSHVTLAQAVKVPGWARWLPVESYLRARVTNAFKDLEQLADRERDT